ncbi:MAG: DUF4242 domain-containing protein [Chloroflexi bacterium]|nr:DUF4242 domain-containing protein [Chloroflexota bacterium]
MIVLDCHRRTQLGEGTEAKWAEAISSGIKDEFGVRPLHIYYNNAEGRACCVSDAPNIVAVRQSHRKVGMPCEDVLAVDCVAQC